MQNAGVIVNKQTTLIGNIIKLFHELQKNTHTHESAIYRIVQLPCQKDPRIHFQLTGKSVHLAMTPDEIMRDDMLLGFSKADIALITHIGTRLELDKQPTKTGPVARIVRQLFDRKPKLVIARDDQNELQTHDPESLYNNPKTAEEFAAADTMQIGYAAAEAQLQRRYNETHPAPTYCIESQITIGRPELTIKNLKNDDLEKTNIDNVFYDKLLLQQFNTRDQIMLAFAAGELSKLREMNNR